ncbi:MAG: tetratricopeptide repeat protein [Candidatus Brocadia sp.]|nr:tetratricopeptide repeat protein [Candidatus Brocadia sp.]
MMRVVKSIRFAPLIALVVQGLFFSLSASEELNKNPPAMSIWERPRYEKAMQYAEKGSIDLAIPGLKKIAELYPDNAEAHAYLGWAYSQKGLIPDAIEELQKVLQINPDFQRVPFEYPMAKEVPAEVGEFIANFEDVIDRVDEFPGAHAVLGLYYVQLGRLGDALNEYKKVLNLENDSRKRESHADEKETISVIDQAIKEYEEVLQVKPDCVNAYIKLACAHAEKGMVDHSIEDMPKAISMEPDRTEAHVYLSCFYAMKGMLNEALHELGEAQKIRDGVLEKLLTEGEHSMNACIFDKAITAAQEAIKVYPKNKKAYYLLATAYNRNGETDKAIETCKEVIHRYPEDVQAYAFLGWMYVHCDLYEDAKELVEWTIRKEPDNAEIRALMAVLYASQDQLEEAITMCDMVIDKISANGKSIKDFGWMRGKVPFIDQKFREVMDILEIKSDYAEAYLCLGWLYSKKGEDGKAISAYKKVIGLTPDSYDAHRRLGNAYIQKGEIKDAAIEYKKALNILSGIQLQ